MELQQQYQTPPHFFEIFETKSHVVEAGFELLLFLPPSVGITGT